VGTDDGAVSSPALEIVPQAAPVQPLPARLQETVVLDEPVIVAVNCRLAPVSTCAVDGETVTATGGMTVTEAVADLVGSATKVAVTDT
jgi:hypothetical protein